MKVVEKRWGEVTIKRQGEKKNKFDQTKSFSIEQTETGYDIESYIEILKIATDITQYIDFEALKENLSDMKKRYLNK